MSAIAKPARITLSASGQNPGPGEATLPSGYLRVSNATKVAKISSPMPATRLARDMDLSMRRYFSSIRPIRFSASASIFASLSQNALNSGASL